jgi:uncharacterized protein (UPF0303 family)
MTDPDLSQLLEQERRLVLAEFDHAAAWRLGSLLREQALAAELPIVISIRRNGQRLFYAALPGSSVDNEFWVERKSAVVDRFGHSSYFVGCQYRAGGGDFDVDARLDRDRFAAHGGAFPLTVRSAGVIGVVAVSGLPEADDHRLVVTALEQFLSGVTTVCEAGPPG